MDESSFSAHLATFHGLAEVMDDEQRFKFRNLVEDPTKIALHGKEFLEIAERDVKAKENEIAKSKITLSQLQSEISSLDNFSTFMTSMTAKYQKIEKDYEKIVGKNFAVIPALVPAVADTITPNTNEEVNEVVLQQEAEAKENATVDCFGDVREPQLEDYDFSKETMKWLKATEAGECCALPKPGMSQNLQRRRVDVEPVQQQSGIHDLLRPYSMATPVHLRNDGLFLTPGAFRKWEPKIGSCGQMISPEEPVLLTAQWSGKKVPTKFNMQTPESPVTPELTSHFSGPVPIRPDTKRLGIETRPL